MKRLSYKFLIAIILLALSTPALAAPSTATIPTFSIVEVVAGTTVTIKTYNLPAGKTFNVRMGPMGKRGVNGIKVNTFDSGFGGSQTGTFVIPSELADHYQIAIRIESTTSGHHAYNWFYNKTGSDPNSSSGGPYIAGKIPTFSIVDVDPGVSVKIQTHGLPAGQVYDVLMNKMGTRGANGTHIATISSGAGGQLNFTFAIPNSLKGLYQIAIRLEAKSGGWYAYNWFYNNATGVGNLSGGSTYYGYPTFIIKSVQQDTSVTIRAFNLPPNDTFKVLMGPMGTRGINGFLVDTINSGTGGKQKLGPFAIPPELHGHHQISIRLQSTTGSGYYAYNWFFNNSTP